MAIRKQVRRKVDSVADVFDFEELVETGGIAFSDGNCIELVRDPLGLLTFLDSKSEKFHPRINFGGQQYVPPKLSPSVLEALTLPTKRTDCGSTEELFTEICNYFFSYGTSKLTAQLTTYFALASWFPDTLLVAPSLMINSTEAEARIFLQLLTCVVRHPLPLAEIKEVVFECLPMHIQPTLLIASVHPSMWRIFSASNLPRAYLPNKNGLTDSYCVKAVFSGSTLGGFGGDATLNVNCTFDCEKLPAFNNNTLEKITAHFQSKLLDYRLKRIAEVQDSVFDAPTLPIPLRMLARALGSCIIDAPELRADIVQLLDGQREALRASRLLDQNCVAIEAILALCHSENIPSRVGVGEIAASVNAILAERGDTTLVESKAMGILLRRLGFALKRDSKGFAIHLTADVRHFIHRVASDHQIGDPRQTASDCPLCEAAISSENTGSSK